MATASPSSPPQVLVLDDMVFTSPNMNCPPTRAPFAKETPADTLLPRDVKLPIYAMPGHPQLGYCAWNTRMEGPILERLQVSYHTVQIQQVHGQCTLAPHIMQSWLSLESALLWVASFLINSSPVANQLFPLDLSTFTTPSKCGYTRLFYDEEKCRRCVMRSRDAFVPLMAVCTMAIAIRSAEDEGKEKAVEVGEDPDADVCPSWAVALKEKAASIDWIGDLMASPISDLSPQTKRIGTILEADKEGLWWHHIPTMVKAHVPVWIYWGRLSAPLLNRIPKLPAPLVEQLRQPEAWQIDEILRKHASSRGTTPTSALPARPPPPSIAFPPVEAGSGQLPGESWEEMHHRRKLENQQLAERESALEKQARLRARELSLTYEVPGIERDAALVYEWIEHSDLFYKHALIRQLVPKWEVTRTWDRYPDSQKLFDEYRREWDLCREIDKKDREFDEEYEEEDYDEELLQQTNTGTLAVPSAQSCAEVVYQAYAAHKQQSRLTVLKKEEDEEPSSLRMSPLEMVRYRYGFTPLHPLLQYEAQTKPVLAQAKAEKVWGFRVSSLNTSAALHQSLSDLEIGLVKGDMKALGLLWDLHPQNPAPFNPNLSIRAIQCIRKNFRGESEVVYSIETEESRSGSARLWKLIVKDPITVMHILRLQGVHTPESLLEYLVRHGVICSTVFTIPGDSKEAKAIPYLEAHRTPILGWIPKGHKFDAANYRHYEFIRDTFLRRRYCRAALLAGGIVWRLAIEVLGKEPGLKGPSGDVYRYGTWHVYAEDVHGGDDILSDVEEDLISGLYKVYTNQSGRQTEDASWWPKQHTWLRSGLFCGHWTEDCEQWFQKRLKAIRSNQAQPKNAACWKDSLKYYQKDSRAIINRVAKVSESYLASHSASDSTAKAPTETRRVKRESFSTREH
ncbi:hypothetical protein EIP91_000274 [Steccherinum ochraceum]|uniref:Uncharacterized protein n=1 Tax=Steccherinum ochraceum TaxID=92696 RepID=A0A4R0RWN9_9APHY|nr:hypothetical protein EIP91_000274 [Steccherinum ochraceum]